jgi:hypothetical protein
VILVFAGGVSLVEMLMPLLLQILENLFGVFSCSRKRIKLLATIALPAHEYSIAVIVNPKLARFFRRLHFSSGGTIKREDLRVGRSMKSILDKFRHRLGTIWRIEVLFQLGIQFQELHLKFRPLAS